MLVEEIKKRVMRAMKEKDELARDVLRVALGEIQTAEARESRTLREEESVAIVRKLVKSNEETMAATGPGARTDTLAKENEVLAALLPTVMSVEEILGFLAEHAGPIREAKGDGQATGLAMKHLKQAGKAVDGALVATAVKQMRASA